MTTWVFVRHGQSEANAAGWFSGHVDVGLTSEGWAQAEALTALLAEQPVARIVSSDLRRASDTVAPLARARGLEVHTTPALRERDLGLWTRVHLRDAEPSFWEVLHSFRARPPQGESLADVAARASAWLASQPDPGGPVVVAAHGGVLRALLGLVDELQDDEIGARTVGNADVFVRRVSSERWVQLGRRAAGVDSDGSGD